MVRSLMVTAALAGKARTKAMRQHTATETRIKILPDHLRNRRRVGDCGRMNLAGGGKQRHLKISKTQTGGASSAGFCSVTRGTKPIVTMPLRRTFEESPV